MKKIVVLCMMIVALGFVAVGCGGGSSTPAPGPAPAVDSHEGHDHETTPAADEKAAE